MKTVRDIDIVVGCSTLRIAVASRGKNSNWLARVEWARSDLHWRDVWRCDVDRRARRCVDHGAGRARLDRCSVTVCLVQGSEAHEAAAMTAAARRSPALDWTVRRTGRGCPAAAAAM